MRFHLRTLLILLAIGPPLLAYVWLTREKTLAAFQRASPELFFQLLALTVALVVVTVEVRRRSMNWL